MENSKVDLAARQEMLMLSMIRGIWQKKSVKSEVLKFISENKNLIQADPSFSSFCFRVRKLLTSQRLMKISSCLQLIKGALMCQIAEPKL